MGLTGQNLISFRLPCALRSHGHLFQANTSTWLVFLAFSHKAPPDPNPGFGLFLAQKTDKLHCCSMLEESFPGMDKLWISWIKWISGLL